MLKIRLQRIGKTGQAHFRIAVLEDSVKAQGQYFELLGSYDPHKKELTVKQDRVAHWLSQGAKMTSTVNNLLVDRKLVDTKKYKKVMIWHPKKVEAAKVA